MKLKFGILGAGNIANSMAITINALEEVKLYAIASRNLEKANAYKEKYNIDKAYGSYEELAEDENVDVIYIATPHAFHFEHAMMCLRHGKHVLCEKAFTVDAKQAEELTRYAREKSLFLGEAMWTRFMPLTKKMHHLIKEKVVGDVVSVSANLNFPMLQKERLTKKELAGGALLDVGIYPLTIADLVIDDEIERIYATGILNENGVDKISQYTIYYKNGVMADLNAGMCSFSDGNAVISCTGGMIIVEGVNCPRAIKVFGEHWNLIAEYTCEKQITGYEYEVLACVRAIKSGALYCEEISHKKTIHMLQIMDEIRNQIGVIFD